MKKILILGGSRLQMPVINSALSRGYFVITCGNKPHDPGHRLSHEYHNISILEKENVLALAREKEIDFVLSYCSEAGLMAAAFIAKQLSLPGAMPETIRLLTEKDRFRNFQKANGFTYPAYWVLEKGDYPGNLSEAGLSLPLVVKPVDSTGCKGTCLIVDSEQIPEAINTALSHSNQKRIIIEEYITASRPEFTGDGFVSNGRLVFLNLGDHHYDETLNPLLSYCTSWPASLTENENKEITDLIESMLRAAGYTDGPFNVDLRMDSQGNIYILELAPRNGGNFISKLMEYSTGFSSSDMILNSLEGRIIKKFEITGRPVANYIFHSKNQGIFQDMQIPD